jgi:tetratricopeptide (TPR) repeat protein
VDEAEAALLRALRLKERLGLTASALLTRNNLGQAYLSFGRLEDARAQFSAIIESGTQAEPTVFALAHSNSGDLLLLEGRLDEAVELYELAHRMNRERANANADSHALSGLIRALLMRDAPGDFERAEAALARLGEHFESGDLGETRRRYFTSRALVEDRRGDAVAALESVRRALDAEHGRRQFFSDVLGSALEAEWIEAVLSARLARTAAARRAAQRAQHSLSNLARRIRDPKHRRVFLEAHPLHHAIEATRLETKPGWTWSADS